LAQPLGHFVWCGQRYIVWIDSPCDVVESVPHELRLQQLEVLMHAFHQHWYIPLITLQRAARFEHSRGVNHTTKRNGLLGQSSKWYGAVDLGTQIGEYGQSLLTVLFQHRKARMIQMLAQMIP